MKKMRALIGQGELLVLSDEFDRLTHHTHTLTIRGDSFRQRNRKKEALPSTSP
jgi:DNA replication protein DnaC